MEKLEQLVVDVIKTQIREGAYDEYIVAMAEGALLRSSSFFESPRLRDALLEKLSREDMTFIVNQILQHNVPLIREVLTKKMREVMNDMKEESEEYARAFIDSYARKVVETLAREKVSSRRTWLDWLLGY